MPCAICNYDQVSVDVWVMKEYGVKETWTRLLSVQKTRAINTLTFLRPLAYSRYCDKIMLEINNQKFAWYNLQNKKMRSVKIGGSTGTFGAEVYAGSLIPLEDRKRRENEKQNEQDELRKRNRKKR